MEENDVLDKPTTENSVINIDTDPALDNNVDANPVPDDMPKIVPPKKEKEVRKKPHATVPQSTSPTKS